jgi:hypothetical protein
VTLLRRALASGLLVAGMLGVPLVVYPLSHGSYAVAALLAVAAISALVAFGRLTRLLPYSRTAATIAALVALVATSDALGHTAVGRTGAMRTVLEQVALMGLTWIGGAACAFAASFLKLARLLSQMGVDRPRGDA